MTAILTEKNHDNQVLNQENQALGHVKHTLMHENDRLHQQILILQKKHENTTQQLKERIDQQHSEIVQLHERVEDLMQENFQFNENLETLIAKNQELSLESANLNGMMNNEMEESPRNGGQVRHSRAKESYNELNLAAEMGEMSRKSSGLMEERHYQKQSSYSDLKSPLDGKFGRIRRGKSQVELVKSFLEDLKNINSSSQQNEAPSDLTKFVSQQVQRDIQRTLKTFVQEDLVETVKSIFGQRGSKRLGHHIHSRHSAEVHLEKIDENSVSVPSSPSAVYAEPGSIPGVKQAAREVFREETGNLSKTLELFHSLCASVDLDMLKALSDTNTKLVESLCASKETVEVLQNQMQTVIESHMEEVTSSIKEMGITDPGEKANLEKAIRESTMEAFAKVKPTARKQQAVGSLQGESRKQQAVGSLPQDEIDDLRDKIERLKQENKELNVTLTRAGRDKLMAMSRLNKEMEKLRAHIRSLQANSGRRGGGKVYSTQSSVPRSPTNSITVWTWGVT